MYYYPILHGRKLVDLQKWRVSVKLFQNESAFPFSTTSATDKDVGKGKSFTVSYLVDSLNLATKLAESISRKVNLEDKGNPDSILNLFRSHGFTDSQISTIVRAYPRLLITDAKKSLGPKLQFLQSRGASTSELTQIISTVPNILRRKGDKSISIYYDYSKERFEESLNKVVEMGFDPATSKFVEALRVIYRMSDKTREEKINICKRLGFGENDVWAIFKKWPSFLSYSEKKITQTFETLKLCGLLEYEIMAVLKKHPKCICSSDKKVTKSIETYIGLGFTRDEFVMMVKRYPQCIDYTAETVKKKTEFLVKKMNWPLEAIVTIPQVFGYSLEKRIIPRCNVIKALISKGVMRDGSETPPMSSVLTSTDHAFLKRYVLKHDELVPELKAIFTGD